MNIYPVSNSNQITEGYYFTVVEMMNNNTTNLKVSKVLRRNGSYEYFTYHLITSLWNGLKFNRGN